MADVDALSLTSVSTMPGSLRKCSVFFLCRSCLPDAFHHFHFEPLNFSFFFSKKFFVFFIFLLADASQQLPSGRKTRSRNKSALRRLMRQFPSKCRLLTPAAPLLVDCGRVFTSETPLIKRILGRLSLCQVQRSSESQREQLQQQNFGQIRIRQVQRSQQQRQQQRIDQLLGLGQHIARLFASHQAATQDAGYVAL